MKKIILGVLFLLGLSSCGYAATFPTTSVLYSGVTANVNPLPAGSFSQFGSHPLKVLSNQIVGVATGLINGESWNVSNFSTPESFVTITTPLSTLNDTIDVLIDYSPGSSTEYELQYYRNPTFIDSLTIQRIGGGNQQIGPAVLQNISAGDSLGLSRNNGILQMWYKPSGGNWKVLSTVSIYTFTVSSSTAALNDTYSNNGNTYTVAKAISSGTTLITWSTPNNIVTGTQLARVVGAGTSSITFSSSTNLDYLTGRIGMAATYSVTTPAFNNFGGGNQILTPVITPPYTCSTNYYIATNGDDSHAGTSTGTAWLTQAHVKSVLAGISSTLPNYCVNYAAGAYTAEIFYDDTISGDATGYLTFRCATYHGCTLSVPAADASDPNNAENFRFQGTSYVAVDGFDLEGQKNTYTFTVTAANATAGDTYTNNGGTYTVLTTITGGTTLLTTSTTTSATSGTALTKTSGLGDSSITFSAIVGATDAGITTGIPSQGNPTTHIVVINNIIANHGGAGIGVNNMDYLIAEGNVVHDTSFNSQYGVSGISDYQAVLSDTAAGYHNIIKWNLAYNNAEVNDGRVPHTDGNGIIMDDAGHSQGYGDLNATVNIVTSGGVITSGTVGSGGTNYQVGNTLIVTQGAGAGGQFVVSTVSSGVITAITLYTGGSGYSDASGLATTAAYEMPTLIEGNVLYGNGGGGIHIFFSDMVDTFSNTAFGNYLDTQIIGTYRGEIDVIEGSNDRFVNNIGYATPSPNTALITNDNIGCLDAGATRQNTGNVWYNNNCYSGKTGLASTFINQTTATISSSSPYFNILGVNPNFTSTSLSDFSLNSPYPDKGSGTPAYGYPTTDFVNNAITNGNVPIGAYQYTVTTQQNNGLGDIY